MAERFAPQPLVVAFAPALRILYDGVAVLNTDCVTQPPDRPRRTKKIPELPAVIQADRIPDDVVMDVRLVDVCTDNESVISFGKALRQLIAQPVGFFRSDLAGRE